MGEESKNKIIQKGNVKKLLNDDIQYDIIGFTGNAKRKITSVIIPLSYTADQINSIDFEDYLHELQQKSKRYFDPKLFESALFRPKSDFSITTEIDDENPHIYFPDAQIAKLKKKFSKDTGIAIDMIHFAINPLDRKFADVHERRWKSTGSFGYAFDTYAIYPGPEYALGRIVQNSSSISTYAHEKAHLFTRGNSCQVDPSFICDNYNRTNDQFRDFEKSLLIKNCLSEYFIEDMENLGKPMKSKSSAINRTIEKLRPEWFDSGLRLQFDEIEFRLLTPNGKPNLMSSKIMGWVDSEIKHSVNADELILRIVGLDEIVKSVTMEGKKQVKEYKNEYHGFSEFQKVLLEDLATSYLVYKGRVRKTKERIEATDSSTNFKLVNRSETLGITRSIELEKSWNYEFNKNIKITV